MVTLMTSPTLMFCTKSNSLHFIPQANIAPTTEKFTGYLEKVRKRASGTKSKLKRDEVRQEPISLQASQEDKVDEVTDLKKKLESAKLRNLLLGMQLRNNPKNCGKSDIE